MKKNLLLFVTFLFFTAFVAKDTKYRYIPNDTFKKGEHIEYLVHYGLINAGVANVDVDHKHYLLNNRVCYKVDVVGKTLGVAGVLAKVNDTWRTYIDTAAFIPHRFYRDIEEGSYRRKELTDFNPLNNTAELKYEEYGEKDPPEKRKKGKKNFTTPDYVQDLISGYYYIRMLDLDKMKDGEVFTVPGLLEDQLYTLKIRYKGKEEVKTKFGKINAHRLVPIMPENGMFSGENSVRFWVSDDKNRVPVKIETDMFIGKVTIEVKDYRNLKHKLNFVD